MKRSHILHSRRTFKRRLKACLEQIVQIEMDKNVDDENELEILISETDNKSGEIVDGITLVDNERDNNDSSSDESDNDESDSDETEEEEMEIDENMEIESDESLKIKLWKWAINRKISLIALTELLKLLKPHVVQFGSANQNPTLKREYLHILISTLAVVRKKVLEKIDMTAKLSQIIRNTVV